MDKKYVMALDQGTTSSRTVIYNHEGEIVSAAQKEITQIYPEPGFVEHNPGEILSAQKWTIKEAMKTSGIKAEEIAAIGITNQRETTVVWERKSGKPVCNAIVWQCRRSASICEALKAQGLEEYIKEKTGLLIDAYFSGTKIKWILDNVGIRKNGKHNLKDKAKNGELLFGTIDTWLIWNLTKEKAHKTDYSNASRTMIYDIHNLKWDPFLLEVLDIDQSMLPEVVDSCSHFGTMLLDGVEIPICGVAGDQQAALFGQACFETGAVKNTYGTGCFMLMNTGEKALKSRSGLITTIAWGIDGKITYALEGSIFMGGAVIQWLRDEMKLIKNAAESEECADRVPDSGGVIIVPAFVGLGAPHWDMNCRGIITGLTRGSNRDHIVRAGLESIAYQVKDILETIEREEGIWIKSFKADGGAASNNFLIQFQADILNVEVEKPEIIETTSLGAAYLAGLHVKFWRDTQDIVRNRRIDKIFIPYMGGAEREKLYYAWNNAIKKALNFND